MSNERINEGLKLVQEAQKAEQKKSFFGKKQPDWDTALQNYEMAANIFKASKSYENAASAYVKVCEGHKNMNSLFMAAKALENAAIITLQNLSKNQEAAELYTQTSDYYLAHGSADRAAESLEKAAKAMETIDINKSLEYYHKCLALVESEDRPRAGVDIFKRAIITSVKAKRFIEAIDFSTRLSDLFLKLDQRHFFLKQALSNILLYLSINDETKAKNLYDLYCTQNGFSSSDEGNVAQMLLDAFENGDAELLAEAAKTSSIKFLENEIAKLASSLKVPIGRGKSNNSAQNKTEIPLSEDAKDLQDEIEEEGFL